MANPESVEVISLGEFDSEKNQRDFDAVSFERFYWRGRLDFVLSEATKGHIYVFSDRNDALGDDYGMKPGSIEEVENDELAKNVIAKAVLQCFDHKTATEAISDGNGGWVTLETDT